MSFPLNALFGLMSYSAVSRWLSSHSGPTNVGLHWERSCLSVFSPDASRYSPSLSFRGISLPAGAPRNGAMQKLPPFTRRLSGNPPIILSAYGGILQLRRPQYQHRIPPCSTRVTRQRETFSTSCTSSTDWNFSHSTSSFIRSRLRRISPNGRSCNR